MVAPISITLNNHTTTLKWHRGRRSQRDPVFSRSRIQEALTLGASVEVDLRVHSDNGCAILHDATLDVETTGRGTVREARAAYLRTLFIRGNDGEPSSEPLMLLEDLCGEIVRGREEGEGEAEGEGEGKGFKVHPNAVLQLDFKDDISALSEECIQNIASMLRPVAQHMILSGGDFVAIRRLGAAVPGLRLGFDPCLGALAAKLRADADFGAFVKGALDEAGEAEWMYLHYDVVLIGDGVGVDVIRMMHDAGKRVDVWTIKTVDEESVAKVWRLLELRADQITTDDAEKLMEALSS